MTARVLTGSKQEIAQKVAALEGEVREAIIFVEDSANATPPTDALAEDIFAEMEAYTVNVPNVDYSRQAIYTKQPGE